MEMKSILAVPFNTNNYDNFVLEFFNEIDKAAYKEIKPNATFANAIEYYSVHGTYKDPEGNDIIVLSVKVKNNSNARQAQRNFVSYLLTNDFNQYSAAMVAYYDDVRTNWKLSFVTVEMELGENGIELKFKPAKRFSFLVGENEPTRTYTQQLGPVYTSRENPTLERITDAFSVNKLSKDFYEDYKKKFFELVDYLEKDTVFENEAHRLGYDDSKKFAVTFAKKTLGQMVFLHFIQKKGWLGVRDKWGDGSQTYLIDSTKGYGDKNYFNEFLEPLFYCALNKKRNNDMYLNSKIPFLNGGLFNPIEHYDWKNTDFNIPNDYWFNDDESGLLNILSQYNFTVDESDPTEQEVAVDPEMLGKIFESLLDVNDRTSLGAFYTPREIVHFMCEESLAHRISSILTMDYQTILNFIRYGDALKETDFMVEFADEIDEIVSKITIVDPAVGSGAFLVGMLNQIVKLRTNLNSFTNKDLTKYEIKLQAIQNSLYGVDIEYDAIEIAKLRLWLSLIVDQETHLEAPKPLPNLNFNLRVGNSLVDSFEGIKLWNAKWRGSKKKIKQFDQMNLFNVDAVNVILNALKEAKIRFFNTSDENEKNSLLREIEHQQMELIRSELVAKGDFDIYVKVEEMIKKKTKPFFIWELEFEQVFENGGFDIVIANPPYIKEYTNADAFKDLKNSPYYQGKTDLWNIFAQFSLDLLKENGIQTFIAPNNWITNFGSSKLRNKLISEAIIKRYVDFGSSMVFDSASIQTMIFVLEKSKSLNIEDSYVFDYTKITSNALDSTQLYNCLYAPNNANCIHFEQKFTPIEFKDQYITFDDPDIKLVIRELDSICSFKLDKDSISQGIVVPQTRLNKKAAESLGGEHYIGEGVFVLNEKELNLLNLNEKEKKCIIPLLYSENICNWTSDKKYGDYIIYADSLFKNNINQYPNLKNHLIQYESINTSSNAPYGLHRPRKKSLFEGKRIISLRKCEAPTFAYVDDNACFLQTFNVIQQDRVDDLYLLGYLNSSIVKFYLKTQGKMQGNNFQVDKEPLQKLPIIISKVNKDIIIDISRNVINGIKSSSEAIKEIDSLLYKEFELSQRVQNIISRTIQ